VQDDGESAGQGDKPQVEAFIDLILEDAVALKKGSAGLNDAQPLPPPLR
jgi:hypothetical protein